MYVLEIYLLTLLKISYEIGIGIVSLLVAMILITLVTKDKSYFTKKLDKLREYVC